MVTAPEFRSSLATWVRPAREIGQAFSGHAAYSSINAGSIQAGRSQNSARYRFLRLIVHSNVPVFRARQAFLQIPCGRRRVRFVAAGNDERWHVELKQVLGFGAGRGIAVEKPVAGGGDELRIRPDLV